MPDLHLALIVEHVGSAVIGAGVTAIISLAMTGARLAKVERDVEWIKELLNRREQ